jgi:hypothetical protein
VDELRQGVAESSRSNVVDRLDGVVLAERRARVNDHLAPPLHLGILPLDRSEVELGRRRTRRHGRGGTSSETDEHTRSSEYDDV